MNGVARSKRARRFSASASASIFSTSFFVSSESVAPSPRSGAEKVISKTGDEGRDVTEKAPSSMTGNRNRTSTSRRSTRDRPVGRERNAERDATPAASSSDAPSSVDAKA